jgi:cellulose synthase/poly-beta-1,6-N-acetylglucosamine synthase-like glycosyltransferase
MDGETGDSEHLRAAPTTVDAAELDAASFGFHRAHPHRSARRRLYVVQALWFIALAALLALCLRAAPDATWAALHIAALCFFAVAIFVRLIAAGRLTQVMWRIAAPARWPTYTILCPLYREANVAADLVAALAKLDYPTHALDVKLLVEADDLGTVAAALSAATAPHIEVVAIPAAAPRTKPKALNIGLARARGEFIVVFDAEDRPHPQQLRAALAAFEDGGADLACVQAPLAVDNAEASWIARQFAAEYAIQFREMLPLLAYCGLPLPLGGTSNHFRADALRAAGGWDPFNVTEDADLGYRLARAGWRADVTGPPTWEEAPVRFAAWRQQRARWIKGHIQTWLVLMRDPWRTARDLGVGGFLAMQLVLGGGVLAAFAHGPLAFIVLTAALSPYDLGPADFILAVSGYCVAMFAALSACALSGRLDHVRAALTMPFYWPLSTIAAVQALFELIVRPHHWSKTTHGVSVRVSQSGQAAVQRSDANAARIASTSASL